MKELIGKPIILYMKTGHVFEGVLREVNEKYLLIIMPNGRYYKVFDIGSIEACSYMNEAKEKSSNDEIPQHIPGDIKSLIELRQLQAKEDLKSVRRTLTRTEPTTPMVEYGNQLYTLLATKNNPRK